MAGGNGDLLAALLENAAGWPSAQRARAQQVPRPEEAWPAYLMQLQLGQQAAPPRMAPAGAGDADLAATHSHLLRALSAIAAANGGAGPQHPSLSAASGGVAAPRAMRLQDAPTSTPLSDLAVALRKQAAAPLPGMSGGVSAFSLASGAAWGSAGGEAAGSPSVPPMSRQSSDNLRCAASGSLPCSRPTPGGIATGKRTGKRTARDTPANDSLPFKKRSDRPDLNHAPGGGAASGEASPEEGAELALVRMRSGEAPPLPLRSEGSGFGEEPTTPVGNQKCSKEKNRQAQRRFRERQKTLIGDLRENVRSLQGEVDSQAKQIFVLLEENRLLKMLLSERQGPPQGQQPQQPPQQQPQKREQQ